jgi:hypothetical protein
MTAGQCLKGGFEIIERVDIIKFACLDQGCEETPVFAALVMTGKKCIFSI